MSVSDFRVAVNVKDRTVNALVDTGSQVSLVRQGLFEKLRVKPTGIALVDAQGQRVMAKGEVELDLQVGHKKVRHTFVVASVTSDLILGLDFLERFKCAIDFSGRCLTLLGQRIPWQSSVNCGRPAACSIDISDSVGSAVDKPRLEPLRELQEPSFPGIKHFKGDGLPSRPCERDNCCHGIRLEQQQAQVRMVNAVRVQGLDLAKAQDDDAVVGELKRWKVEGSRKPSWKDVSAKSPELKSYWAEWDALVVENGLLCRRWQSNDGRSVELLPIVPSSMQSKVLEQIHNSPSGGHFGRKKTLSVLKARYYWINRNRSVLDWCRNCKVCCSRKGPRKRQHGPAQLYLVGAPMERVAVDIVGPLPVTEQGNKYMLVAMDYFTKWPEVFAIPDQEAVTIARALVEGMFCRFGAPMELHSDQGRNFESAVFAEVCRLFGVSKTRTTPGYPQSDGMVERFNRTLLNALASFVDRHQKDWDLYIPFVMLAYRNAVHESTGTSPSLMMFGREVRGPVELLVPRPIHEEPTEMTEYGLKLRGVLEEVHERARGWLDAAGCTMKRRYDRNAEMQGFQVGDAVWLYNPRCKKNTSPKLASPWEGPYRVTDRLTDVVYRIQLTPRSKPRVVNRYRLWRVSCNLPADWWDTAGTGPRDVSAEAEEPVTVSDLPEIYPEEEDDWTPDDDRVVTTRYGRTVKRPQRLGIM